MTPFIYSILEVFYLVETYLSFMPNVASRGAFTEYELLSIQLKSFEEFIKFYPFIVICGFSSSMICYFLGRPLLLID
jgi:hypothetical protein